MRRSPRVAMTSERIAWAPNSAKPELGYRRILPSANARIHYSTAVIGANIVGDDRAGCASQSRAAKAAFSRS